MLHLISYMKNISSKYQIFYFNLKESSIYKVLAGDKITTDEDTVVTFTDSSWNNCIDTGRSADGNCSIMQGGSVDHSSHLPISVAMSSAEAEYISAAAACMRTSRPRMLIYDLKDICTTEYNGDKLNQKPVKIIIGNEAAKTSST